MRAWSPLVQTQLSLRWAGLKPKGPSSLMVRELAGPLIIRLQEVKVVGTVQLQGHQVRRMREPPNEVLGTAATRWSWAPCSRGLGTCPCPGLL